MSNTQKYSRLKRVRLNTRGTSIKPRLSVYRSNKFIYAQVINDEKGETIVGVSESELTLNDKANKSDKAKELGIALAKKAIAKKVSAVVFDRGSYRYHGRVKAVAEGAREGGLKF